MCCDATLGVILPSEKPADSELIKKNLMQPIIFDTREKKKVQQCAV